jgi:hypothetical protein
MDDCRYNTLKILYEFCKTSHFIKMHAKNDAKKVGDEKCYKFLEQLEKDLEKYTTQLNEMICK